LTLFRVFASHAGIDISNRGLDLEIKEVVCLQRCHVASSMINAMKIAPAIACVMGPSAKHSASDE
jgi:hypothetical protein